MNGIFGKELVGKNKKLKESKHFKDKRKKEIKLTSEQIEIAEKIKFWEIQKEYNQEIVKRLKTYEKQITELKIELESLRSAESGISGKRSSNISSFAVKTTIIISVIAFIISVISLII